MPNGLYVDSSRNLFTSFFYLVNNPVITYPQSVPIAAT